LAKRRSTDNLSEHRAPSAARDAATRSRRSSWLNLSSFLRSSLMSFVRITLPLALLLALVGCKKKNIEEAVMAKQEQHEEPPHERAPSADDEGYMPSMTGTPGPALHPGETRQLGEDIDESEAIAL